MKLIRLVPDAAVEVDPGQIESFELILVSRHGAVLLCNGNPVCCPVSNGDITSAVVSRLGPNFIPNDTSFMVLDEFGETLVVTEVVDGTPQPRDRGLVWTRGDALIAAFANGGGAFVRAAVNYWKDGYEID